MAERMSTRLFLVRHGATQLSAEDRFAGATDVELSEEGIFQAGRLAERLADDAISAVYCSPMTRTKHTASILAKPHGLPLIQRDGLREIHHGHWEGMTRADVEVQFPDEYVSWEEDPYTFAPEGGENGVSVIARTLPVIREIVVQHRGENVLIVSHKATLRLLISSVLGFDGRGYRDRLRPVSCQPERARFQRPGAGSSDAVQRCVTLYGSSGTFGRPLIQVVG